MGVELLATLAIASTTTASILNYRAQEDAASNAKSLANEQESRLRSEQAAAEAEARRQATTGQSFGFTPEAQRSFLTGFGFNTGSAGRPNGGRGQLLGGEDKVSATGMG